MEGDVFHAPIANKAGIQILDVGCGSGYVTNSLALKFPDAKVAGLDIAPVPDLRSWPANVRFLRGDITQPTGSWESSSADMEISEDGKGFHYIFGRLMLGSMTEWTQ